MFVIKSAETIGKKFDLDIQRCHRGSNKYSFESPFIDPTKA